MYIQTIFHYEDIKEEIYVEQPISFLNIIFLNHSYLLKRTLYGII